MVTKIEIKNMELFELNAFSEAMKVLPWYRDNGLYSKYLEEQNKGHREFIIAKYDNEYAGHVCLIWESKYHFFRENKIPEISDLLVLQQYQRKGIAEKLVLYCEQIANIRYQKIGLGVGLYKDYYPAQNLYRKLDYRLDGCGATSHFKPLIPGELVKVDDDLVIWLVKNLH